MVSCTAGLVEVGFKLAGGLEGDAHLQTVRKHVEAATGQKQRTPAPARTADNTINNKECVGKPRRAGNHKPEAAHAHAAAHGRGCYCGQPTGLLYDQRPCQSYLANKHKPQVFYLQAGAESTGISTVPTEGAQLQRHAGGLLQVETHVMIVRRYALALLHLPHSKQLE